MIICVFNCDSFEWLSEFSVLITEIKFHLNIVMSSIVCKPFSVARFHYFLLFGYLLHVPYHLCIFISFWLDRFFSPFSFPNFCTSTILYSFSSFFSLTFGNVLQSLSYALLSGSDSNASLHGRYGLHDMWRVAFATVTVFEWLKKMLFLWYGYEKFYLSAE